VRPSRGALRPGPIELVALAATLSLAACVTGAHRPPDDTGVVVYQAPSGPDGRVEMPAGCRLLAEGPRQTLSEADLATPDTFPEERARAARSGGNVLLLVERLVAPRQDFDCAAAQPITDCPKTLGAWYEVVTRSYDCDATARSSLPPTVAARRP
jgi:hypothetical protein